MKALAPATRPPAHRWPQLSALCHFLWGSWAPAGGSLVHPSLNLFLQLLTKRGGNGENRDQNTTSQGHSDETAPNGAWHLGVVKNVFEMSP